ncbi:hypothetical protein ACEPAI_1748 [Sanghuangporus weigelae]
MAVRRQQSCTSIASFLEQMREMAVSIGRRVQYEATFSFFEGLPKCSPAPLKLELEEAPRQDISYSVLADDLAQMSWALNESVINSLSKDEPALSHPDHLSDSILSDNEPNRSDLFKEEDGRVPCLSSPCPTSIATTRNIEAPRDLSPEASSSPVKVNPSSKPTDPGPLRPPLADIPNAPPIPLLSVQAADESAHIVPTSDDVIEIPDAPASRSRKRKRQTEVIQEDDESPASSGGPIVCDRCNDGRTFFNLQTLRRHYKDVHLKRREFCPGECRLDSFRKDSLLRHIRTMGPTSKCWLAAVKLGWLPRLQAEVKRVRASRPRKKRRN